MTSLTSVVRGKPQETLGTTLSRVRSSHEAVFIFDKNNKFVGLISPYKTLYSRNYPYATKVSSILFRPPTTITQETPVYEVAKFMLSSKIYVLPVFDNEEEIQGVIDIRDILRGIINDEDLLKFVSKNITPHIPITAPINSSVKDIFHDLKEKGVSRMIIVNSEGDLAGIVTRNDLMQSLIKPTSKLRFPKEGSFIGLYSLAGEKKFRQTESIRKYFTVLVDSLPNITPQIEITRHLITSPHDSVVLVDKLNKPTGFLSTRDMLQAILLLGPEEKEVLLIINKPSDAVSDTELEQATEYLQTFGQKLKRRIGIEKIEVTSEEPKSSAGNTKMFNITVILTPVAGKSLVANIKNRKYLDGIQEATKIIEKQHSRSGLTKTATKRS